MPSFKEYLRSFSNNLGILETLEKPTSYNFTQAKEDVVATFDGFMQISVSSTYFWVNVSISGREAPVLCLLNSSTRTELSATIPIQKGRNYHIDSDWASGRFNVTLFPLRNTN